MITVTGEIIQPIQNISFPSGWFRLSYGFLEYYNAVVFNAKVFFNDSIHGVVYFNNNDVIRYQKIPIDYNQDYDHYKVDDGAFDSNNRTIVLYWNDLPAVNHFLMVDYTVMNENASIESKDILWKKHGF